jgi:hypothetical protein
MTREDLAEREQEAMLFRLMAAAWLLSVVGCPDEFCVMCSGPDVQRMGGEAAASKHVEGELGVTRQTIKAAYDLLASEMGQVKAILFLARGLRVEDALDKIIGPSA